MTKTEIINETANFYSEDTNRRSISPVTRNCYYYLKDKKGKVKKCAIGRCMSREGIKKFGDSKKTAFDLFDEHDLEISMKKKYKGHSANFWGELQTFHDLDYNWFKNELSVTGQNELKRLLEKYKDQ